MRTARDVGQSFEQRHRFAHVLAVTRMADTLAQAHGVDPARARLAALLHDLARLYSAQRLLRECEGRGMPIDAFERRNPIVLHARLGAELARERYGIDDERILSAIRAHTLGAPSMSRLDTIVYLADGLEPGRDFPERERLERLALEDLEAAMRATLRSTIAYLAARGLAVAPATTAAIEHFARTEEEKQTA